MSARNYLLNLICDAAPDDGEAQRAIEAAVHNGRIRLTESRLADLARCKQWLERRRMALRRQQLHEACAA